MRKLSILLLILVLLGVSGGCTVRHSRHNGCRVRTSCQHDCDAEIDPAAAAIIGGVLLVGAIAAAADDTSHREGRASASIDADLDVSGTASARARAKPSAGARACLYNPHCLPASHPRCANAPDGCCPCD